jgi:acyl carrier protein
MNEAAIYEKLNQIFRDTLNDDSIALTPSTTADDLPGWDSMNHIFLVVETERGFGIKFQTAEMEELHNVGEFVHLIRSKLAKAA